ncbi:ATP-dependent sacrificial sulfur transferase LarE [Mariniluteicoccus endophyticus]
MATHDPTDELAPGVPALMERLAALPGLVVTFSGGADSAFLVAAAARALGPDRVLAVTAHSDSMPRSERDPAAAYAASLGVTHRVVETREMDREGYRANAGDRCYFCKAELVERVLPVGEGLGWPVATGTNADDVVAGFRPGIRAAAERGAITPLADAGIDKATVREQSRRWALPTWDKPAAACLSSRVAYGLRITPARLARVERAENGVRSALPDALRDLRVRDLGDGRARVEVDRPTLDALGEAPRAAAAAKVTEAGFDVVEWAPFRSGSMNDALRGV